MNRANTVVEYIWLGGNNSLRSKTRILHNIGTNDINEIPDWNFDGSSTGQASGEHSELILKPKKLFMNTCLVNYVFKVNLILQMSTQHILLKLCVLTLGYFN